MDDKELVNGILIVIGMAFAIAAVIILVSVNGEIATLENENASTTANISAMENYLDMAVALKVFPSGAQLESAEQQQTISTK
jgi:uncharacterized membrane protein YphA (DoxX/SURF4 family)